AELHADDGEGVVAEAEQRRAAPAARQPLTGRLHQARALEIAYDGRHRRRAEPGAARQVGARDLALLPDEVEQQRRIACPHPLCIDGRLLDFASHESPRQRHAAPATLNRSPLPPATQPKPPTTLAP